MRHSILGTIAMFMSILAFLGGLENATAQSATPLSAEDSDPKKLGWMMGFPPPPE